jgi:hypothetical protein
MNIIKAVKEARKGKKIRREIWDKHYYIKLDHVHLHKLNISKFYIPDFIHSGEIQTFNDFYDLDILADDWEVME